VPIRKGLFSPLSVSGETISFADAHQLYRGVVQITIVAHPRHFFHSCNSYCHNFGEECISTLIYCNCRNFFRFFYPETCRCDLFLNICVFMMIQDLRRHSGFRTVVWANHNFSYFQFIELAYRIIGAPIHRIRRSQNHLDKNRAPHRSAHGSFVGFGWIFKRLHTNQGMEDPIPFQRVRIRVFDLDEHANCSTFPFAYIFLFLFYLFIFWAL